MNTFSIQQQKNIGFDGVRIYIQQQSIVCANMCWNGEKKMSKRECRVFIPSTQQQFTMQVNSIARVVLTSFVAIDETPLWPLSLSSFVIYNFEREKNNSKRWIYPGMEYIQKNPSSWWQWTNQCNQHNTIRWFYLFFKRVYMERVCFITT